MLMHQMPPITSTTQFPLISRAPMLSTQLSTDQRTQMDRSKAATSSLSQMLRPIITIFIIIFTRPCMVGAICRPCPITLPPTRICTRRCGPFQEHQCACQRISSALPHPAQDLIPATLRNIKHVSKSTENIILYHSHLKHKTTGAPKISPFVCSRGALT